MFQTLAAEGPTRGIMQPHRVMSPGTIAPEIGSEDTPAVTCWSGWFGIAARLEPMAALW